MSHDDLGPPPGGEELEASPARPQDLGVALSGGGVRAALFSLGVVIGLIETQCHKRVRCIASVSGGSILNAALAHARSLGAVANVEDFEPLSSKLARSLASRGAFAFEWRTIVSAIRFVLGFVFKAILPVGIALLMLIGALSDQFSVRWPGIGSSTLEAVPWSLVGLVAGIAVVFSLLLYRGPLQQFRFEQVLVACAGIEGGGGTIGLRPYLREWQGPPPGGGPEVMHVLVATDLLSGEPMYFSRQFVYCRPYGWSRPRDTRTATALYSSAAFPAVFPPKRLPLRNLSFQNGEMPGDLPRTLRLADGGVYNNLGTDWFDVLRDQSESLPPRLWPFGELAVELRPRIDTENVIVVNAGAPSRTVSRLGPFPLNIARIMSVLYDNTVKPRIETMRAKSRPVIDIKQSPADLARSLEEMGGAPGARAKALGEKLQGASERFWRDFTSASAGTATKLSKAGVRTSAQLMLHGYLMSLVLLHVRYEAPLPERLRGEEYFLSLVSRLRSHESPAVGAAATSEEASAS